MSVSVTIPGLNLNEDEIKLLLAIKLFEEGIASLGKASEISGYSEKAFAEILIRKGISPVRYSDLDLKKEKDNALQDNHRYFRADWEVFSLHF